MGEAYSPHLGIMETIVPALLGLSAAAVLSAVVCICAKQIRIRQKKQNQQDAMFAFQPTRRPKAVRSPSGQPPHYLKKSPSPTNVQQIGILQSMPDESTTPVTPQKVLKYTEEDETQNRQGNKNQLSPDQQKLSPIETKVNGIVGVRAAIVEETREDYFGKLGTIYFKLRYMLERNALMVSIIRCRGLPGKGAPDMSASMNGRTQTATDPYVKLQLLPEKQHKVKTRVVRNTRNPVYEEDFTFYGINLEDLENMALHFIVLSFDRYSRDDVIGEVICALNSIDIGNIANEPLSISRQIQQRCLKIRAQGRGELLISLCWQPAACRLTVVLLKARNLPRMDVTGLADPYVKIYLLYNGQRIAKKKTHVKKRTLSPVFNESFAFDIPAVEGTGATLDGVSMELLLLDWDRVTKNEIIGRLELGGPKSRGTALNHWNEVCNSPRRQIAEWHKLNE